MGRLSDETKAKMAAGRRRYLEERRAAKERELAQQEQELAQQEQELQEGTRDEEGAEEDHVVLRGHVVRAKVTVWRIEGPADVVAALFEQITGSGEEK